MKFLSGITLGNFIYNAENIRIYININNYEDAKFKELQNWKLFIFDVLNLV